MGRKKTQYRIEMPEIGQQELTALGAFERGDYKDIPEEHLLDLELDELITPDHQELTDKGFRTIKNIKVNH